MTVISIVNFEKVKRCKFYVFHAFTIYVDEHWNFIKLCIMNHHYGAAYVLLLRISEFQNSCTNGFDDSYHWLIDASSRGRKRSLTWKLMLQPFNTHRNIISQNRQIIPILWKTVFILLYSVIIIDLNGTKPYFYLKRYLREFPLYMPLLDISTSQSFHHQFVGWQSNDQKISITVD